MSRRYLDARSPNKPFAKSTTPDLLEPFKSWFIIMVYDCALSLGIKRIRRIPSVNISHCPPQGLPSLSTKSDPKKTFSKMGNTKGLLAKRATGSRRQVWWWKRRVWLPAGKSCIIGLIVVLFTFILFFPIITCLSQSNCLHIMPCNVPCAFAHTPCPPVWGFFSGWPGSYYQPNFKSKWVRETDYNDGPQPIEVGKDMMPLFICFGSLIPKGNRHHHNHIITIIIRIGRMSPWPGVMTE